MGANDSADLQIHSADAPIDDAAKDLLGRAGFATELANDIRRAPVESGFVVGLTGPWGSGKTSVLKLVERELGDDVAAVVTFNPWLFSGTEQLVDHFFAELAGQLEASGGEQLGKVTKALRGYGRIVSPLRYLPFVGEIARASSEAALDLGAAFGPRESSAQVQAVELKERLTALERPIVIMVDDLDRLRKEEIVDVVRLVRLVGDFPSLVYLLAFDLGEVERALGDTRESGRAYLDKIIHIAHALPPVRPEDLTEVLRAALEEVVPEPAAYRFDKERFVGLFWTEVRSLFATVRDVRRYINVLATTLALLGDEVDFSDILALEAIRLFEPEAFEGIVKARYALTGALSPIAGLDVDRLMGRESEADKELVTEIPKLAPRRRDSVERIIKQLFPRAEVHFGGSIYEAGFAGEWKRRRRVAEMEVLDVYLYRRLAPGSLPAREVEETIAAMSDRRLLDEIFDRHGEDELRTLFSRLADFDGAFPDEAPEVAIEAVLARGIGFGDGFSDMSGSVLVDRLLRGLPRARIKETLERLAYPNLSRRYELVRMVGYRERGGMVEDAEAAELAGRVAEAVLACSAEDLVAEEDLGALVWLAQRERGDALRQRLSEWLSDDAFFVRFVFAHLWITFGVAGREGRDGRALHLNWSGLLKDVELEVLQRRIEEIAPAWVEAEFEEDVVTIWEQACHFAENPAAADAAVTRWPRGDSRD